MDDLIGMTRAQLADLQALRLKHRGLSATVGIAVRQAQAIQQELEGMEAAIKRVDASEELQARADSLNDAATEVLRGLRGGGGGRFGGFGGGQQEDGPQPVQRILADANGIHQIYAPPTEAERAALERAGPALQERLPALNELVAAMVDFRRALDGAGVPWTPGRMVKPPV